MHFDDRLATVLHHRASGERAARVQFRQLLDLLGSSQDDGDPSLSRAAYRRLDAISRLIPVKQRERLAAECSGRIRNVRLVAWLASAEPAIAIAALARVNLTDGQWTALIPELPVRARGLLRHRATLPQPASALLERLGVFDRALPEPIAEPAPESLDHSDEQFDAQPAGALELGDFPVEDYVLSQPSRDDIAAHDAPVDTSDLGALVKRIEAFQRARAKRPPAPSADSPPLPLVDDHEIAEQRQVPDVAAMMFTTDTAGRVDWAEPVIAPLLVGTLLASTDTDAKNALARAFAGRRPVTGAAIRLGGGEAVAGDWIVDAAPRFAPRSGIFQGYVGRCRRPAPAAQDTQAMRAADRVRQLLHELRTPVTAIQGFAEVIQQQTVGPVPHEYRALAAAIAGDAARMLAGFAELERLARLEAGTQDMPEGTSDFVTIVRRQTTQLQSVLSPRVARLDPVWSLAEAKVPLAPDSAETLAWRFLGTVASAAAAGERIALELSGEFDRLRLTVQLPAALAHVADVFAADVRPAGGALGVGLFGAGFALRLARAEARAAGGELVREGLCRMILTLPLATPLARTRRDPHRTSENAGL